MTFISFLISFLTIPLVYNADQKKIDHTIRVVNKSSIIFSDAEINIRTFENTLAFYPPKFLSKNDSLNLLSISTSVNLLLKNIENHKIKLNKKQFKELNTFNNAFDLEKDILLLNLERAKFDDIYIGRNLKGIENALKLTDKKKDLFKTYRTQQNNLAQKILLSYKSEKFKFYLTISIIFFNLPLFIKAILLFIDRRFRANSLGEDILVAHKIKF